MNILLCAAVVSAFLLALLSVSIICFVVAALIWHFFPNSKAGIWIADTFSEPVYLHVEQCVKGGCISPQNDKYDDAGLLIRPDVRVEP